VHSESKKLLSRILPFLAVKIEKQYLCSFAFPVLVWLTMNCEDPTLNS